MVAMFDVVGIDKNGRDVVSAGGQLYSKHWDWAMSLIDNSTGLIQIKFRFYNL